MTLPDELAAQLKQAAELQQLPLAQFIRETMTEKLRQSRRQGGADDPFATIRGLVESPETDLSGRIDEVLYSGDPHQ